MSWERFLGGDDSPRRVGAIRVPESDTGFNAGVELIVRLPLSLVLLATTVLLTTITYVAMTVAMIVILPVRFLAGFFSERGRKASADGQEEGKEPVNGVRNFFVALIKVFPTIVLWPVLAVFTSVPALIVSTFMYVSSIVKSVVEFMTCAFTFGDPTKVPSAGRASYDNYVAVSGIRAATDLAVRFFDDSGPHAGVTTHWSEVKSAVTDHGIDIMKSMLGGGIADLGTAAAAHQQRAVPTAKGLDEDVRAHWSMVGGAGGSGGAAAVPGVNLSNVDVQLVGDAAAREGVDVGSPSTVYVSP
ncbi:hypothetical protein ACIS_00952 [Anaplasma centrale str. Israel]|uniref:Uncharacterized protein n=1 Tax=Anaplasma centrale (strain Israel) TaxID=574556 RepID=D1ASK0_ANACI|nr:hypothetical protein [Anaplasma centrale]ACZ49453.1 hypothetical protein ACIS_00952 [Anaplasma centrale str. Israel]